MIVAMHVQLIQYDERGRRATFYVTGMEHSTTSSTACSRCSGQRERTLSGSAMGGAIGGKAARAYLFTPVPLLATS